jgi:hypothetical protein
LTCGTLVLADAADAGLARSALKRPTISIN